MVNLDGLGKARLAQAISIGAVTITAFASICGLVYCIGGFIVATVIYGISIEAERRALNK